MRTILGPFRRQDTPSNNPIYRRWCYMPIRLGWAKYGKTFGAFGWEMTHKVLGPWQSGMPMTGSRQRPHIFGWTLCIGRLRIMFGPPTREKMTRDQLRGRIYELEDQIAEQREAATREVAELRQTLEVVKHDREHFMRQSAGFQQAYATTKEYLSRVEGRYVPASQWIARSARWGGPGGSDADLTASASRVSEAQRAIDARGPYTAALEAGLVD